MTHETDDVASFGVSQNLINDIREALDKDNLELVVALTRNLHAADMADVIDALPSSYTEDFIKILKEEINADILAHLDEYTRERIIEHLTPQEVATVLSNLESDDAVLVIENMDDEQQIEVLNASSPEDRATFVEALSYPDYTAGRIMQREYVTASSEMSVQELYRVIRHQNDLPDRFFDIFIVDNEEHLLGVVSLDTLARSALSKKIQELMTTVHITIPVLMDQDEVSYIFEKYNLASAPVITEDNKLVGMITVDDALTISREEAAENITRLGGVSHDDFHVPVFKMSVNRFCWLFITFINTLIASSVLYQFQDVLENHVELAVLMPIIAAMGGNSGMQIITIMVRAISERNIKLNVMHKVLAREVMIVFLNTCVFSSMIAGIAVYWYQSTTIGLILGSALMFNMLWSSVAGTLLPITIHRLGLDPAIGSGPVLTTTTDVLGFTVFLGLGRIFLGN